MKYSDKLKQLIGLEGYGGAGESGYILNISSKDQINRSSPGLISIIAVEEDFVAIKIHKGIQYVALERLIVSVPDDIVDNS